MDRDIEKLIEDHLKIKKISDYEFKESCGFTFVFKKEILFLHDEISSGEIKPIAIIYEENGQYYLAPIDVVDQIDEVIKEFVKQQIQ